MCIKVLVSRFSFFLGMFIVRRRFQGYIAIVLVALFTSSALGQGITGSISGRVNDQTDAVIANAHVRLRASDGRSYETETDGVGEFRFQGLASAEYSIAVEHEGFLPSVVNHLNVISGSDTAVVVKLAVAAQHEEVQVQGDSADVLSAETNASSVTLRGQELDALSEDPDELKGELDALAGPAAGPNRA
jgi:hypothetical protein